jgi:di/tricarboxylate transporter
MDPVIVTALIIAAAIVLFVWNRLPVIVVAVATALALWATGILTLPQALAGFGDPAVLFIAALFVVSAALERTGVTAWAGQGLSALAETGGALRVTVALMLLVALLAALISVTGAAAALLPVALVTALRLGMPASRLLMPVVFAGHAGSMLALTGSPVNVLVAAAAEATGRGRIGFFDFTLVGLPLLAGTMLVLLAAAPRLLPAREGGTMAADLSAHAGTLARQYGLQPEESRLDRQTGLAEVMIPPRSPLAGKDVYPGMMTPGGELMIVAIHRAGRDAGPGRMALAAGDTLLLRGSWAALDRRLAEPGVLAVDPPAAIRAQAVPLGPGAYTTLAVLAALVLVLATGLLPAAAAALLAAGVLIVSGAISVEETYATMGWTTVILVAALMPLSTAMETTGAARVLADGLVAAVGGAGPTALLAGLFLLAVVLGQLISNTATAVVMLPIGIAAAEATGISPLPVLMCLAIAAAGALLTPIATPANLMVMAPGGYRFADYARLGLPVLGWFFAVAVLVVPLVFPF